MALTHPQHSLFAKKKFVIIYDGNRGGERKRKETRLISIESQPKKVVVVVVVVVVAVGFVVGLVVLVVVVSVSHRKPIFIFRVWSKLSQLLYVVSAVGVDIL